MIDRRIKEYNQLFDGDLMTLRITSKELVALKKRGPLKRRKCYVVFTKEVNILD